MGRRVFAAIVTIALVLTFAWMPPHADAQTSISNSQRIEELARQLEATQTQLERTQAELQDLRGRDAQRAPFDTPTLPSVPPTEDSCQLTGNGGGMFHAASYTTSGSACCPDCGKTVCPGLPHLCLTCKDQLSWNKGKFRIVPYGAVVGEMVGSNRSILMRGSPLYLVPGPAPNIDDSRFTVSGQQSTIGLSITGPKFGSFQSGANVAANFFGEQPILNNPGLFFMFAYAELKNDDWRFWVGQAPDAIGRQNTNSPAWSSH